MNVLLRDQNCLSVIYKYRTLPLVKFISVNLFDLILLDIYFFSRMETTSQIVS